MQFNFEDAKGRVKQERKALHAWATRNPFTFGTVAAIAAFVLGHLLA
jgi:hypothetical protein